MIEDQKMFDERKAAEMAAYILLKEKSGKMDYRKLIKLMYLAEIECIKRKGRPMIYDNLVSEENGPVLSETLDLIKRNQKSHSNGWNSLIYDADLDTHTVSVKEGVTPEDDFDILSQAEEKIIDGIWNKFKDYTWKDLSCYTHDNCVEWEKPKGKKSEPIETDKLLKSLGYSNPSIKEFKERLGDHQSLVNFSSRRTYI